MNGTYCGANGTYCGANTVLSVLRTSSFFSRLEPVNMTGSKFSLLNKAGIRNSSRRDFGTGHRIWMAQMALSRFCLGAIRVVAVKKFL